MNTCFVKICLLSAMVFSAALILAHVGLMSYGIASDTLTFFWLPLLLMASLAFYSVFAFKTKFPLILIVLFALVLHLIQFVRQPSNMIWSTDAIYHMQLVNNVLDTGHWFFGFGTGEAYAYSFYPFFDIFQSILCSVTGISSMLCVKYSMAFLNLLELGGIYFLLGFAFNMDARTKNLIILMFSFNPLFNGFESYAVAEAFAIILFPLVLALALGQEKSKAIGNARAQAILLFLVVAIVLSHHFTSYMVAFSFVIPAVVLYLLRKDFVKTWRLYLLSLVLPLSWAAYIAYPIFLRQLNAVWQIITRLTSVQSIVGYSYSAVNTSSAYYPSNLSMQIALIRTALLVALALIGLIFASPQSCKKAYNHFRVLLIAYGILTVGLLYFVDWRGIAIQGIGLSDVRDRIVGFAYLPISFFLSLGILTIIGKAPKWPKSRFWRGSIKLLFGGSFIVLLTTASVFTTFDRVMYDTTFSPISIEEFSVAPLQKYALGLWVLHSISRVSSENIVFTGSSSAQNYVVGYGLFNGTWDTTLYMNISLTSINNFKQLFYVVNTYNFLLPDALGIKLNSSTTQFLDNSFSKVYDNGVIYVYQHQSGP